MKVAPVSADLLVKLALGAAVLGGLYYLVQAARGQITDAAAAAADWAANVASTGLNPVSDQNYAYRATNAVGGSLVTDPAGPGKNADGSWSFGGWLYDVTH